MRRSAFPTDTKGRVWLARAARRFPPVAQDQGYFELGGGVFVEIVPGDGDFAAVIFPMMSGR